MKSCDLRRRVPPLTTATFAAAALVAVTGLALANAHDSAGGSTLPRDFIITGPAAECGGGPQGYVVRRLVIILRAEPGGRAVANYTLEPGPGRGSYAFSVSAGVYKLTTNSTTSTAPGANIVIAPNAKPVTEVPVSTPCQ